MKTQLMFFAAVFKLTLVSFAIIVLLNNTVVYDINDTETFSSNYISKDELNDLIEKNKIVYRYFYCYDSRDEMIGDHIYTVNMPDFKEFEDFYSFVASVYTSDAADELFNDFQGHGRSFFEEDGLFLADQAVTFTATASLYSPYDKIQILPGNDSEKILIYWFALPQRVNVNGNVIFDSFGVKIPIVKENNEWKLIRMIRTDWCSDNAVFGYQAAEPCGVFSPVLKIGTYIMKLKREIYRNM